MATNNAATTERSSFDDVIGRLDEIVETVRNKDTSLEASLDLLDEAIGLGMQAAELIDISDERDAESSSAPDEASVGIDGPVSYDQVVPDAASSDGIDA